MLICRVEPALAALLAGLLWLSACTGGSDATSADADSAVPGSQGTTAGQVPAADDVIARVGDQPVTFSQINTMLNSSAMVGLSVPALGTADRTRVVITLLDKVISANLLYLDALRRGVDQDPGYRQDTADFSDALLARLYRQQVLEKDLQVEDAEVEAFHAGSMSPDEALTDETRQAIEVVLRNQKAKTRPAERREQLREGIRITVHSENLEAVDDEVRPESEVVALIDAEAITWGEVQVPLQIATRRAALSDGSLDRATERRIALDRYIDYRIMIRKAREAGFEQDPVYRKRADEFYKTRLINTWRDQLVAGMEPSAGDLVKYYEKNRGRIVAPESRRVQMVVLETREAAEDIKRRIESGELTIHQAAREYSLDPNAKRTLGDMGWVSKGSGFPELDRLTFSLGPDEIGGPVQSPAGWHVVVVTDVRDARYEDIKDAATRAATRRMLLHDRLDEYVVKLRQNEFEVSVYNDRLQQLFSEEAAMVAELESRAQQPDSLTRQREAEYQTLIQP